MIQSIPVELILIILRGLCLSDVLSFTRTSSHFRYISLTNRIVWVDASDSYKLSIALGETLKTAPPSLLPQSAARSVSIEAQWHSDKATTPRRTYEPTALYSLPSYAFWSPLKHAQHSLLGHAPPAFMNILPGGRGFLFGSMAQLGVYGLHGEYGCALEVPTTARFEPGPGRGALKVDWASGDNGGNVRIGVLSRAFDELRDVRSYVTVFAVQYSPSVRTPSVRRTHLFTLPIHIHATALSVQGPRILVRSGDALLLADIRTGQRALWALRDSDCAITSATIYPAYPDSVFFVAEHAATRACTLQVVDIPLSSTQPNFDSSDPEWPHVSDSCTPRIIIHPPGMPSRGQCQYPASCIDQSIELSSDGPGGRVGVGVRETRLADPHTLVVCATPFFPCLPPAPSGTTHTLTSQSCIVARNLSTTSIQLQRSAHGGRQVLATPLAAPLELVVLCPDDRVRRVSFKFPSAESTVQGAAVGKGVGGVGVGGKWTGTGRVAFDSVYGVLVVFVRGRVFVARY